jgi:hypothetical protein
MPRPPGQAAQYRSCTRPRPPVHRSLQATRGKRDADTKPERHTDRKLDTDRDPDTDREPDTDRPRPT